MIRRENIMHVKFTGPATSVEIISHSCNCTCLFSCVISAGRTEPPVSSSNRGRSDSYTETNRKGIISRQPLYIPLSASRLPQPFAAVPPQGIPTRISTPVQKDDRECGESGELQNGIMPSTDSVDHFTQLCGGKGRR